MIVDDEDKIFEYENEGARFVVLGSPRGLRFELTVDKEQLLKHRDYAKAMLTLISADAPHVREAVSKIGTFLDSGTPSEKH